MRKIKGHFCLPSHATPSGPVFFFFPVNIESVRERHFFNNFHAHFFAFTGTFWKSSRARECVHGHFSGRFHGHFWVVHGQKYRNCSRALFEVHGQIFMNFEIYFSMFTGFIFNVHRSPITLTKLPCSRAVSKVHGHFFWKCSRALSRFTGTFS